MTPATVKILLRLMRSEFYRTEGNALGLYRDQADKDAAVAEHEASKKAIAELEDLWSVWRHPGTQNGKWRQVPTSGKSDAENVYSRELGKLRQGVIELRDPIGKVVMSAKAPALRTRW